MSLRYLCVCRPHRFFALFFKRGPTSTHTNTHTHIRTHKESLGKEDKIKAAEADVERATKRVDDALEGALVNVFRFAS